MQMNFTALKNKFRNVVYSSARRRATGGELARVVARADGFLDEKVRELRRGKPVGKEAKAE